MIAAIPDQDKKKQLLDGLTGVFLAYVNNFHHQPFALKSGSSTGISDVEKGSAEAVLHWALKTGTVASVPTTIADIDTADSGSSASAATVASTVIAMGTGVSVGLRHQTFAAFTVLHLIGHSDVRMPLEIYKWAFDTVCVASGEPAQLLAVAAVIKLTFIAAYRYIPANKMQISVKYHAKTMRIQIE